MTPRLFAALLALACGAFAGQRSSANYRVTGEALATGRAQASVNYAQISAFGEISGAGSSAAFLAKPGFAGQLYDVVSLSIGAVPGGIDEAQMQQLAAFALADDSTFTALPGASVAWSVVSGPITGIGASGGATASVVAQDTPATVRAEWSGFSAQAQITVRDIIPDNFGLYAGDGLDDAWQVANFGTENPLAAPGLDPDGDGQTNRFEFTAGLTPTDPVSRFTSRITPVPLQPAQRAIVFKPRLADRNYTVEFRSNLATGSWSALPAFSISDNGDERTVIDPSPGAGARFYRVRIDKP